MDKNHFHFAVTDQYDIFKFLDANRIPNVRFVSKLEKSITEHGLQVPIIVNPNREIVDGQHRFLALRNLGHKVPYLVSNAWKVNKHTEELNNSQRSWNALDYANFAIENGNVELEKAMDVAKEWNRITDGKMTVTTGLELLSSFKSMSGSALKTYLKNNSYKLDLENGLHVFAILGEMSNYPAKASIFSARIVRAMKKLNRVHKGLDIQVIKIMCKKNYIPLFSKELDQYEYLNDIYVEAKAKFNSRKKK
jgi:hypothetical protein